MHDRATKIPTTTAGQRSVAHPSVEPTRPWWALATLFVGVLATALTVAYQRRGLVATPDGAAYLGIADNLAHGRGLTVPFTPYFEHISPADAITLNGQVPLTQWPPLFPIVLAGLVKLGMDPVTASRILNPVLVGVVLVLVGVLMRRWTGAAFKVSFPLVAMLILVQPVGLTRFPLIELGATPLTEPLFYVFVLATLLALDVFIHDRRTGFFWVACALAAAASLTRLLGLSLVAAVALTGALVAAPMLTRFVRTVGAIVIGVLPVVPTLANSGGSRRMSWDSFTRAASDAGDAVIRLFPPITGPWDAQVAVAVGALLLFVLAAMRIRDLGRPTTSAPRLVRYFPAGLFCVVVLIQLGASQMFVDRNIAFQGRQTSAIGIVLPMVVVAVIATGASGMSRWFTVPIGLALATLLTVSAAPSLFEALARPPRQPPNNNVVEAVTVAPDLPIFTNTPDGLWIDTRRSAYLVPCQIDYFSGAKNPAYGSELDELVGLVRSGRATVVLQGAVFGFPFECGTTAEVLEAEGLRARDFGGEVALLSGG